MTDQPAHPATERESNEGLRRRSPGAAGSGSSVTLSIGDMETLFEELRHVAVDSGFSGVIRADGPDGLHLTDQFGLAHRGHGIPNSPSTQFAIASGGKGFTALAVVGLVAKGLLSLDTTARSVLGDQLPLIADDVTVEHLLAHRSGIGDYLDEENEDLDWTGYLLKRPVQELADTDAFISELDGYPTKFGAGEGFSYCNAGYVVLALIAERAGGVGYHQLVEETVIQPAGLINTAFLRSDEPSGRMAIGYLESEGLRTNVFHLPVRGNGDGGIYTTAGDMREFWTALFDGRIVPGDWVDEMTRARSEPPQDSARYGMGFWLADSGPGVKLVGSDTGVSFYSSHDPSTGATWTIISNTQDGVWPLSRLLVT